VLPPPLRPVRGEFPITREYGFEDDAYTLGYHTGTDFGAPLDTRVRAPRSGVVVISEFDAENYGHYVMIHADHAPKAYLVAHLSKRSVKVGEHVERGQTLGRSGASGWVSAAHCHAEQRHAPFGFRDSEKPDWED
jgi:murein DD-endopeptidase MepM/ murein hydrolase activator NlpD